MVDESMRRRQWLGGCGVGIGVGLAVATVMTTLDWWRNPGGIFRDAASTNWNVVIETGWSWLLPVAAISTALTWLALFVRARIGKRD